MGETVIGVLTALLFVVPGYIVTWTRRKIVVLPTISEPEFLVQSICGSTALYALALIISGLCGTNERLAQQIIRTITFDVKNPPIDDIFNLAKAFSLVLISSCPAGMALGCVQRKGYFERFLRWRDWSSLTEHTTEWDHLFAKQPTWLQVNLKDGTRFRGLWVGATAHPEPHELLLKEVVRWHQDNPEDEEKLDPYSHIWINPEEIATIYAMCEPIPKKEPPVISSSGAAAVAALNPGDSVAPALPALVLVERLPISSENGHSSSS